MMGLRKMQSPHGTHAMKNNYIEVTKDRFYSFLSNYGKPLEANFQIIGEPPGTSFWDDAIDEYPVAIILHYDMAIPVAGRVNDKKYQVRKDLMGRDK